MLKKGDKVIWKAGKISKTVYAIVTEIKLVDDPLIKDWKPIYPELQRLERVAWRLIRKNWAIVTIAPLFKSGTFFARGTDIDPLPIDKQENIQKWEENMDSIIRNEMFQTED